MNVENISEKLKNLMRGKNYVPRTVHEIASELGLDRRDVLKLKKILFDMAKNGEVARVKGDRYGALEELDLVSGAIDFRPNGRARMKLPDGSEVEFRPEDTGVALNGDKILARVIPQYRRAAKNTRGAFGKKSRRRFGEKRFADDSDKKYARVVRILERKNESVIGTLKRNYNFWHVVPDDPKFFYDVIVSDPAKSAAVPEPKENDKVSVRLNEWRQRHINPTGEIVENFGESHTPMAEYRAILSKYDLSETFPQGVLAEVSKVPSSVSKRDVAGRCDMRGKFTITIDPEDAKDFDDAISLVRDKDGWEIGVHIADVSYYVKPNTATDKEACARGNSTYLVGTVLPMLPFELSNGICSLVEDEDRLVKSVFMRFDKNGACTAARFANSVIRSVKRLSYEQAHALITEDDDAKILAVKPPENYETAFGGKPLADLSKEDFAELKSNLRVLWSIASTIRKLRMKNGSLDLEIPEFKIFCDKDGYADRIEKIEYNESHQLIEEFMLAANEAVARALFSDKIPYISRVHDDPDAEKLAELRDELETFGITCGDLTSRKEVLKVLAQIEKHQQSYLLKTKFLRSLKRAEYRASADGHYGLNKVYYAHFTSPIRRYADLTVHRNLDCLMRKMRCEGAPKSVLKTPDKAQLETIAAHISATEQNSADAERDSRKVKLMEFFERAIGSGKSFEAIVSAVSNHGFFVELTESAAFGFVHVHTMRDDIYRLSDDGTQLRGRSSGTTFRIGDRVRVEVESVDRFKRQIDFHIAAPAGKPQSKRNRGGRR